MTVLCRLLGAAFLVVFAVVAFTPLVSMLGPRPAGAVRADAAVVLGGSVSADGALSDSSLRRAVHGIRLYKKGFVPLLVMSGGGAPGVGEAAIRADLARDLGVPEPAILMLRDVRTTRDEAAQAARLLLSRGARHVLIVTDPLHMARAQAAFAAEGFQVSPAPTSRARVANSPAGRLRLARDLTEEWLAKMLYRASRAFQRSRGDASHALAPDAGVRLTSAVSWVNRWTPRPLTQRLRTEGPASPDGLA